MPVGQELVDHIRAGRSLEQVAKAAGLEVREAGPFTRATFVPGLGRANAAIGTAFGLRPGQTSGLVEADDILYIIEVAREGAMPTARQFEEQKDSLRARMTAGIEQERIRRFMEDLRSRRPHPGQPRCRAPAAPRAGVALDDGRRRNGRNDGAPATNGRRGLRRSGALVGSLPRLRPAASASRRSPRTACWRRPAAEPRPAA